MGRLGLMVVCWIGLIASPAMADPYAVRYSVTGLIGIGGGPPTSDYTYSFGSGADTASITFHGPTDVAVEIDTIETFSYVSFGEFVTTATGSGATIPANAQLYLSYFLNGQERGGTSVPIFGEITPTSSTVAVSVEYTPSADFGGVTYTVYLKSLMLAPPSTNGGVSTLQGTLSIVPEPASLGLMGVAAMGLLARRRRAM